MGICPSQMSNCLTSLRMVGMAIEIWFKIRYCYKQALETCEWVLKYTSGLCYLLSYLTNDVKFHNRKKRNSITLDSRNENKTNVTDYDKCSFLL